MTTSCAQIITVATQTAKCPGFLSQAEILFNAILAELCQDYDFEVARGTTTFNFNPGLTALIGNSVYGSGPYPLPADYLRMQPRGLFWTLLGVPYRLKSIDLDEFDAQIQQAGNQSFPSLYTTDLSLADETAQGLTTPALYVYMPPSGAYPVTGRYYRQMPDVTSPSTNNTAPWFPSAEYLIRRLSGELMLLTGDDRAQATLGDPDPSKDVPGSACSILRRYLAMKDDKEPRAQRIRLDERRFGPQFSNLKNTKTVGW